MWKSYPFILLSLLVRSCSGELLAPALYVFGDSLSDSGNNNYLSTAPKANYIPYGVDHPLGTTGRFNNGKTVADFIAEFLGLPFPPPYLGLSDDQKKNTKTGVNYASAACGILDNSRIGDCLSLSKQISLFQQTVERDLPGQFPNPNELSSHLSKAIFEISIGSNDYRHNYFSNPSRGTPEVFAKDLVEEYSEALQKLYNLGARKFVVFEIGLVGCTPNVKYHLTDPNKCNETLNDIVSKFNDVLTGRLQKLGSDLNGSGWVQVKNYAFTKDIYLNPSKYGLTNLNTPCCGVSPYMNTTCLRDGQTPCQNRNQYFYWDSFHPTEAVSKTIGEHMFNTEPSICTPMNVQELARSCVAKVNIA